LSYERSRCGLGSLGRSGGDETRSSLAADAVRLRERDLGGHGRTPAMGFGSPSRHRRPGRSRRCGGGTCWCGFSRRSPTTDSSHPVGTERRRLRCWYGHRRVGRGR